MLQFEVFEFAFACCSIAAVALLIWDNVITFGMEVRRIWSRKFSGTTVLYAFLRYGTLVEKIAVLLLASWYMSPKLFGCYFFRCNIAVRFQIFPMALRTLAFGMFSSLRVYALMGKDWPLALFVLLLCIPTIVTPAYSYSHQLASGVNMYGCQLAYIASQAVHTHRASTLTVRIAGIVCDILSETIVIGVTMRRTFKLRRNLHALTAEGAENPGVAHLLLKDGTIYFTALLILSLADMLVLIFDYVPQSVIGYDYWVVPYYTPVFRTIIICRFLLSLRAIFYDEVKENTNVPQIATLRFATSVVGTMGATVTVNRMEEWDEDGEEIAYSTDPFAAGLVAEFGRDATGKGKAREVESSDSDIEELVRRSTHASEKSAV